MIFHRLASYFRLSGNSDLQQKNIPCQAATNNAGPDAAATDRRPWIGVDLDGTLALDFGWRGPRHIGVPVPMMVWRVRQWIADGRRVKIMTARAMDPTCIPPIRDWLARTGLPRDMEITCCKDFLMIELWDDRTVQVITNRGQPVSGFASRLPDDFTDTKTEKTNPSPDAIQEVVPRHEFR